MPAELAAQLPQPGLASLLKALEGDHRVRKTRIAQLHIGAGVCYAVHLHGTVQTDGGGIVEADAVAAAADPLSGYHSGGGLHPLRLPCQAVFKAVAADAAGAVAAHLAHGAVRVEKQHFVIAALGGGVYHHEAVSPDGEVPFAQDPGQPGKVLRRQVFLQVVQDDKVVACAVHFPKFHKSLRVPAGILIKMKTSLRRLPPLFAAAAAAAGESGALMIA